MMTSTMVQFIIDDKGEKFAAVIPMKIYANMLDKIEELKDIELYDAVKAREEPSISLEEYRLQRDRNGCWQCGNTPKYFDTFF